MQSQCVVRVAYCGVPKDHGRHQAASDELLALAVNRAPLLARCGMAGMWVSGTPFDRPRNVHWGK